MSRKGSPRSRGLRAKSADRRCTCSTASGRRGRPGSSASALDEAADVEEIAVGCRSPRAGSDRLASRCSARCPSHRRAPEHTLATSSLAAPPSSGCRAGASGWPRCDRAAASGGTVGRSGDFTPFTTIRGQLRPCCYRRVLAWPPRGPIRLTGDVLEVPPGLVRTAWAKGPGRARHRAHNALAHGVIPVAPARRPAAPVSSRHRDHRDVSGAGDYPLLFAAITRAIPGDPGATCGRLTSCSSTSRGALSRPRPRSASDPS